MLRRDCFALGSEMRETECCIVGYMSIQRAQYHVPAYASPPKLGIGLLEDVGKVDG